ncbi:MAG: 2'-5' RNA ligase family protein [Bacteroidota bacterium]
MSINRYFLALIPTKEVREELQDLKIKISDEYQTKASLRSPPHLTLHMPFLKPAKYEKQLIESLTDFCNEPKPFDLTLNGYGSFEPKVFFVQVVENQELKNLHQELHQLMKIKHNVLPREGFIERPFRPHITLAFRDLKKQEFYRLWKDFQDRNYERVFMVSSLALLKHNGISWDEHHIFSFGLSS